MKTMISSLFVTVLMLVNCGSTPAQDNTTGNRTNSTPQTSSGNTFNGILVEVIGIPYEYKDICGNRTLDNLIEREYALISTGQSSSFVNFNIEKFVFNFLDNGGLVLSTVYSYDRTPADNGRFFPAQSGRIHEWKLEPKYHTHSAVIVRLIFTMT